MEKDKPNRTYSTIYHELREYYKLDIVEYLIVDLVCSLSKDRWCTMSKENMGKQLGISRPTVIRTINKLVKWRFIYRELPSGKLKCSEAFRENLKKAKERMDAIRKDANSLF